MRLILHGAGFLLQGATTGYFYRPGALDSLETAAGRLQLDPQALRARCECLCERNLDVAVARLPGGVVGIESQGEWRFRFPVGHALSASGGSETWQ